MHWAYLLKTACFDLLKAKSMLFAFLSNMVASRLEAPVNYDERVPRIIMHYSKDNSSTQRKILYITG